VHYVMSKLPPGELPGLKGELQALRER